MRTLIALATIATTAWSSLGQGTVDFRNETSVLGIANDYMVRDYAGISPSNGTPLVGTNYVAQLYYGPVGSDPNSFAAVAELPAHFRDLATTLPGTWDGGLRTIPAPYGINGTTSVVLQVRVWDLLHPEWTTPCDQSSPFIFNFHASSPPQESDDNMINFRGFGFRSPCPEPSTFALLSLGALGLCLFRRK